MPNTTTISGSVATGATRYATAAELKARLSITDTTDDSIIGAVLDAVTHEIDGYCGRVFTSTSETRYYTAEYDDLLMVDDFTAITTLQTDEDGDRTYEYTWATTDYYTEPYNAALASQPYTRIAIDINGDYSFPVGVARGVKLTATYGYWTATPAPVKEACLIQSARIFKRKDAPFGVMGAAEMGQLQVIPTLDPDVKLLLAPYRKLGIGGV